MLLALVPCVVACTKVERDVDAGGGGGRDGCVPACEGVACGADGCGGICGSCPAGQSCSSGTCVGGCVPSCEGSSCGDDGCGGSCGTCPAGQFCDLGTCEGECVPSCGGRECGSDGCGGSCGTCASGETCDASGTCTSTCVPSCSGRECGSDGCGGSCGTCASGETCDASGTCACVPSCGGRVCGSDGCGGSCGTCTPPAVCSSGACVCTPTTCYRDQDGDGYPRMTLSMSACTCPSGYVPARSDGQWDCEDTLGTVHPGATTWQTMSYCVGARCTPSYDYDCNGMNDQRYPTTGGGCVLLSGGMCLVRTGWIGSTAPNCSVYAMYVTGCTSCMPDTIIRQQSCR